VNAGGTVESTSGPVPTVTHVGPGVYGFDIGPGVGTGCPLPQLTGFDTSTTIYIKDFGCSGGFITVVVLTGDGTDHAWVYMVVGV
jgi:hypothetical protein